jgi:probable F420-dependent oxidoreductase
MHAMELGRVGVWWSFRCQGEENQALDVAAELEELGYGALWSSGGIRPGLSSRFERLLASTQRIAVAAGIASIWLTTPADMVRAVADLEARHPGRFLLGLGASHAPLVENYRRPYGHMAEYLEALDASHQPSVAPDRRVLAALRPRMLALAGARSAGAHPYFSTVAHTARAREIMGKRALLAPEVTVVLEPDPATARRRAREFTTGYLTLTNYANSVRALGFSDDDLAGGGSNRLVDAVVAWGDVDAVARRVAEHHEAGADHVCVQVIAPDHATGWFPLAAYRELAPALGLG